MIFKQEVNPMSPYIQIITSINNKKMAEEIAQILVKKNLVACVQIIGPMKSIYRWQGKIEKAKEWMCLMKTKSSLYGSIEKVITRMHPYTLPEIIVWPIRKGYSPYLQWISKTTKQGY